MLDPIWDRYTDEELIAEYFAHLYIVNKDAREDFLHTLRGTDESIYEWLDSQVENNQKEMKDKADQLEDEINFDPSSLGD